MVKDSCNLWVVVAIILIGAAILIIFLKFTNSHGPVGKEAYLVSALPLGTLFATTDDADPVASIFGGTLATNNQITNENNKGAQWCTWGWINNAAPSETPVYEAVIPMVTSTFISTCDSITGGDLNPGINPAANPVLAGVTVYGVKPKQGTIYQYTNSSGVSFILTASPFDVETGQWSRYKKEN